MRIVAEQPVAGGDIHAAFRARTDDGRTVFVKRGAGAPAGMFEAEAAGLDWLRGGSLRVPAVLEVARDHLVLEWLELAGRPDPAAPPCHGSEAREPWLERFGRGLAELHARGAPSFGLDRASYLAMLPQDNMPEPDWPTFYIERRLRPLCARAQLRADALLDRLHARPDVFGPPEPPARLHGDLWWGNVGAGPAIFDPAVYGGHREIDLAMLALFDPPFATLRVAARPGGAGPCGLPDALVAAYDEIAPLAPGWRARLELHQLYPLAAHACLFGGSYGSRVLAILRGLT